MFRALDVNGECPACGRAWKEAQVGAISQVIRLCHGSELRGFQCPWCASRFTPAGDMVTSPRPPALDAL